MTPIQFALVNGSMAVVLLVALIVLTRAKFRAQQSSHLLDGIVQFTILFAGAVLLTTRPVYVAVERLIGLSNVAWLLSYLMLMTALLIAVRLSYKAASAGVVPHWPRVFWLISSLVLVVIFATNIVDQPSYYDHALARSLPELLFMSTLFAYAAITGSVPARFFYKVGRAERDWQVRLRSLTISFAASSGVICMVLKLLYTVLGFVDTTLVGLQALWLLMWLFFLFAGAGFLISGLPMAFFGKLASVADWLHALWMLHQIAPLNRQLTGICPPVVPEHFTWQHTLADPHYRLYRQIVYLFDCQRLLPQYLGYPHADFLYTSLQSLPQQSQAIEDHVAYARNISREVKQRMESNNNYPVLTAIATWLSRLVHPFTVVVPTLVAAAWLEGASPLRAMWWSFLSVPIAILPISLYILSHVRSGRFEDWDVSIREQRGPLFLLGIAGIGMLLAIYSYFNGPWVLKLCLIAAIVAYGIGAVVNKGLTKISLHATAAAGAATVMGYLEPTLLFALVPIVLAGGWSRLYLNRHTVSQILLGWVVAILSVTAIFSWLL